MHRLIISLICAWGFLHPIGLARAAGSIVFSELTAAYTFADHMTLTALVTSESPVVKAVVFFQSGSQPPASQPADPFTPAPVVSLTATIDLKQVALTPFSTVSYWWEVTDESGQTAHSEAQSVVYVDNRFAWQDTSSGPARVHWYQGDSGYGAEAAAVVAESLPRLQQQIGVDPPSPIDIYLYSSGDDLRSAVELAGRDWLGGQARPELGVVLVAIPPGQDAHLQMRHDIPHELSHLMTFVAATPNYSRVPRWLDEGLATLNEGEPSSTQALAVQEALADDRLIPLEALCAAFPQDASQALLAYGQSRNVVQHIIDEYGSAGIQALLAAYRDGATCAGGVERGLNTTLTGLDLKWRAPLQSNAATANPIASSASTGFAPWLILIAVITLPLMAVLVWRKPNKAARGK